MIWATVSSQSCFCCFCFSIFSCKEYNQPDFGVDHLVISICRVFSCVVGRGCLLWPVRYLGKTLLAFALLHSVFQGQIFLLLQVFPHSSTLAWKIPRMEEPGGLQSMGLLGVGDDWVTSLSLFTFMHSRKWEHTPVFLPGESHYLIMVPKCNNNDASNSDIILLLLLLLSHFSHVRLCATS